MNSSKFNRNFKNFTKAVDQLSKALREPETELVRDASIQRFEFTYELLWKTLKTFLEEIHGVRTVSPRQVFKEAFALDLIEKEDVFLEMIEVRNMLAHTYNEELAIQVYRKLPDFLKEYKEVLKSLDVDRHDS